MADGLMLVFQNLLAFRESVRESGCKPQRACLATQHLTITLTKAAGICKPAGGEKVAGRKAAVGK
jgi:hypothetical protein